jgi:hypothetical protein
MDSDLDEMNEGMIMRKEGQVMTVQNGELKLLEEETTMPDGTRVLVDGTLVLSDGTTRVMAEGETLRRVGRTSDTAEIPDVGSPEELTDAETHDPTT